MRVETGARLRADWSAKGKPDCPHETLSIERYFQSQVTGAYVCTQCGELFKSNPWTAEPS
jgi:hypothetical protein